MTHSTTASKHGWRRRATVCATVWMLGSMLCSLYAAPVVAHDSGAACRAIEDAKARLACYDGSVVRKADAPIAPAVASTIAQAPEAVAPAPAPVAAPTPRNDAQPPAAPSVQQTISEIAVTATGRHRFRLGNGELWEQIEPRATDFRVGDQVSIGETLFGAWRMSEHTGTKRSFKVRRLE